MALKIHHDEDRQFTMERLAAQRILDDPQSDQLSRDLAHLRLTDEDGTRGDGQWLEGCPLECHMAQMCSEWLTAEAYESGLVHMSDAAILQLIEDPLLKNKCNTIKAVRDIDGRPNIFLAYPMIARAVEQMIQASDQELRATAFAVMACLKRPNDPEASIECFKLAIRVRPGDWRLRSACASSLMSCGKTSLALGSLSQAERLAPDDSLEKFEIQSSLGKVLFNLERPKDAKKYFLTVIDDFERFKDRLSPLDAGHHVPMLYMLCMVYINDMQQGKSRQREALEEKVKQTWNEAEQRRLALSPDVRQRMDWSSRHGAQAAVRVSIPCLLNHLECHYCRQLCESPRRCAACKFAFYCSKECQVADWKSGHKQKCSKAKTDHKEQKKDIKVVIKQRKAVLKLPPLDAKLDPYKLWAKAKKLTKDNATPLDSVFYFVIALFLDFSLDAQDLSAAEKAVDASPPEHPLTLALAMMTNMKNRGQQLTTLTINYQKAMQYYGDYQKDNRGVGLDLSESLDQLDRVEFGVAMCVIFNARMLSRIFSVRSIQEAESPIHKKAFDEALTLINEAKFHLDSRRWLTFQFELGYSNFDIGAAQQARTCLETFLESLKSLEQPGKKLTKHWKKMRQQAQAKLQLIPTFERMQQSGAML